MNRILGSLVFVLVGIQLFGQNIEVSPYTFYGYGDKKLNNGTASSGMGGLSTAYLSPYGTETNFMNPAANHNLRLTNFVFEGTGNFLKMEDSNQSEKQSSSYLSRVSLGFPITGKGTMGIAFQPYSSVGYSITQINETQQGRSVNHFDGEGGLNTLQMMGSYKITPELALGVRADYLFGKIIRKEILSVDGAQLETSYANNDVINGFSFTSGISYHKNLKNDKFFNIGATYGIGTKLNSEQEYMVKTYQVNPTNFNEFNVDTVQYANGDNKVKMPSTASFGVAFGKNLKWSLGAQVDWEKTSGFNLPHAEYKLNDRFRTAIGGYYIPQFNSFRNYFARATYRAGAYYEKTPLMINGNDISDYGITFGIGLPIGSATDPSELNIGVALGQRGTIDNDLIKESYANLKISFTLNDAWFKRRKYD